MEFKDYLSGMRKSKKITVRKFASDIGISPSFLCDLESGNRSFPSDSKVAPGLLGRIISALDLNEAEAEEIRILADQSMLSSDRIPPEISDYLKSMPEAQLALRKAKEAKASKELWEKFIKSMEEAEK